MSKEREFDIIVWGATGLTGRLVSLILARKYGLKNPQMKIALAGRSETRLKAVAQVLLETSLQSSLLQIRQQAVQLREALDSNPDTSLIPIIAAPEYGQNAGSTAEISKKLASRGHVVIAAAGPYALYGESILRACAETGTDYIDCTGEYTWVRDMYKLYQNTAQTNKARILPFCGLAYLLNDIGVAALQRQAEFLGSPKISEIDQQIFVNGEFVSHGTLKSLMGLVKNSSLKSLCQEKASAVYDMCDFIPTNSKVILDANKNRLLLPWYSYISGSWMRPTPLGRGATRYIHWVNELKNYEYGTNFIYQFGEPCTSLFSGCFRFIISIIAIILIKVVSKSSVLTNYLYTAIAAENMCETITSLTPYEKPGYSVAMRTIGHIRKPTENTLSQIEHEVKYTNGEAYFVTGLMLVDTAVTCLKLRKNPSKNCLYGFGSPSSLLRQSIEDELKQSGFSMTFKFS